MSTEEDDDTPNHDRPGIARSRSPDYPEREEIVELSRKRKKTGEYEVPDIVRAVRKLEGALDEAREEVEEARRGGSVKTWGMIAGLLFGGGGVGHSVWHSNGEEKERTTLALELDHEREARKALERDVEKLQEKFEKEQVDLAVCCERRK